ncbi:peptide-methionine (S)-S-oxide reductase MsrA [Mesorhizobium sp. CCNWLW179-1]|uniref:peptide-methionine (S)-S-oxide reductase MsrA n=1 Tax=unclassified Mesorhizobium TaxID=325217 RepID=UPI0030148F9C
MKAIFGYLTQASTLRGLAASTVFGSLLAGGLFIAAPTSGFAEAVAVIPPPAMSEPKTNAKTEKIVLAGGCFWGVQGVFQHVKGVENAVSGYAGGAADSAQYEMVGTGRTGHAESVEITFDPKVVSYGKLLQVYFSVAHNPTELNRQGPDSGTQYRSTIFAENDSQKKVAAAYIKQLNAAKVYDAPIVTTIETSKTFYPAESYHQDYATLHPESGYIAMFDLPKIEQLSKLFPDIYRPKAKLVADAVVAN